MAIAAGVHHPTTRITPMQAIQRFPRKEKHKIRYVLTDIDDTLTVDGRLPAVAFSAMEALHHAGIRVVPITGRPARRADFNVVNMCSSGKDAAVTISAGCCLTASASPGR